MTNLEISAERESPLKDSQARMSFHFLSPTGITSFEWYTGFVGILDCVAWVSSMRDCSNSVEQSSLSCATDLSKSYSLLVGLCLGSLICNWLHRNFDLALSWMEFEFQCREFQEIVLYKLGKLVQLHFVMGLRHKFRNLTQHEGVFSLCMLEFGLQNHNQRLQRFCSTFQQKLRWRMTHPRKLW